MNLRRRQKRKTKQALDAAASVSKLWTELRLGKRAAKGVEKVKEIKPPSKLRRVLSFKWVRIGGAVAVVGGAAAAVANKLKRSDPADYSGPAPSKAADASKPVPETAPPLTVAPDPATQERDTEPASGPSALRKNRDEAAAAASADAGELELAGDLAAEPPDVAAEPPDVTAELGSNAEPPDATAEPPDAEPPDADAEKFAPGTTVDSQGAEPAAAKEDG